MCKEKDFKQVSKSIIFVFLHCAFILPWLDLTAGTKLCYMTMAGYRSKYVNIQHSYPYKSMDTIITLQNISKFCICHFYNSVNLYSLGTDDVYASTNTILF